MATRILLVSNKIGYFGMNLIKYPVEIEVSKADKDSLNTFVAQGSELIRVGADKDAFSENILYELSDRDVRFLQGDKSNA